MMVGNGGGEWRCVAVEGKWLVVEAVRQVSAIIEKEAKYKEKEMHDDIASFVDTYAIKYNDCKLNLLTYDEA